MSILDASLRKTWDALRARKQVQDDFLDEVRLKDVPKAMVRALADLPEIARIAGRLETEAPRGDMAAFSVGLTEQIDAWRQAGAR